MNKFLSLVIASSCVLSACAQSSKIPEATEVARLDSITFCDYSKSAKVDEIFNSLSDGEKVAQLIMPAMGRLGQSEEVILKLVRDKKIGGVLMLNGTKEQFTNWINNINSINAEIAALPFLFSADAEPSLFNRKITGSTPVKKAVELQSEADVLEVAKIISKELNEIGINYNFSPVSDMSSNATVGYRGFGKDSNNIVPFSMAFIQESKNHDIIATAKHFPGHGLVSGDTHKALQVIDGDLRELWVFEALVKQNVPSIMIGHLAVKNNSKYNTNGLPATVSKVIVTDLLRTQMGYNGLIVTDAMNMGGVTQVANANVLAVDAGCDILLMPIDAAKAHAEILKRFQADQDFRSRVSESVKRVIAAKICVGIL